MEYKIGLHVHTTLSDGRKSPDEVARIYKEAGFDAIAEGSRTIVGFRGKFSPLPSLHSLVIRQYNCGKRALSGTKISV